ncbi:MAG: protein BatD [Crocinitomicaceae bacterium]|nr:protein BatD [Crocinitomicaceae bacterium]
MKYILNIVFLLICLTLNSQTSVTAEVSAEEIMVNDYVNFILRITNPPQNGKQPKLDMPDFEDFEFINQQQHQGSQAIIGPGGTQIQVNFTLIVTLKPKKVGTFTIGSAKLTFGDETFTTKELSVKVNKSASGGNYPDKPMFARIIISKSSAYIGEPVTAVYKLYSRFQLEDVQDYEPGNFDGFQAKSIYDIYKTQNVKVGTETINGKRYQTLELKKVVLFPLKSGEIEIDPFKIKGIAQVDFFRSYSDNLVSNSPVITIKEIPDKPIGYNGAVGQFTIKAEVNKEKIEAGEAFDLNIVIEGKGNTHLLEQPTINLPPDFEIYGDPEIIDKTDITAEGSKGSLEYNFVVRASTEGKYTLGPIVLNYFDPTTKTYQTSYTDSFQIEVKGGNIVKSSNGGNAVKTNVKTEIESKDDIRFITKDEAVIESSDDFLYGKGTFWTLLISPLMLSFIFIFAIRKRRNRSDEDIANLNRKHASKMALKVLKNATNSLNSGDNEKFYEELHLSMIAYLKNKLNLDLTEMTKSRIQEIFKEKGLSEELGTSIFEILDQCQMARYAPIDQTGNKELIAKAEESIHQIQKVLK